jgi:GTP-binding protein HflX
VILPWDRPNGRLGDHSADRPTPPPNGHRSAEHRLAEAVGLASSIGLVVAHTAILPLRVVRPATLLGEGQVASQGTAIAQHGVTVAIVDTALSPVQQRNLERAWQ